MKGSFIMFGIAGMLLMAACSTSNYTQKTSSDDLYSPNASSAPAIHHSQTNSSPSDQVIDPPVIVDRSEDQTPLDDNSSDNYNNNGYNNNGYDNNGYQGYNSYNGSSWDNSAMDRMGYSSSAFGYYGPSYSGFTMYSPLYYSPGFSMSLGFSFGTSMFYSPMWNSYAWMPMPPPPPMYYAPVYPYYPYAFGMYSPMCMNPYSYMDPYGYYGGLYNNYYYGGYYSSPYYNNSYYGPRGSTGNNTSTNGSAKVYGPGRSSNPIPNVNSTGNHRTISNATTTHTPVPLNGGNGQQMQVVRRSPSPAVMPSAPRMAPSQNLNSGHPKNEFRPMPQAFESQEQPEIYRNNFNHEARPQNTERFHQTLNEESKSRNFEQHPVQNTQRSSSSSSNNSPHSNGNRQYR